METQEYYSPDLSDAESMVLRVLCRCHMLDKPFCPAKIACQCAVPVWIIRNALNCLVKRNLVRCEDDRYIPLMQETGAPVPELKIRIENGIKIIECPTLYARGYARKLYTYV